MRSIFKFAETLEDGIKRVGPWFHNIELGPGIRTRELDPAPGPQPVNHPHNRWEVFKNVIPADLSSQRILDIGSADGFFAIELARRGAHVVAVDAARKMIERLEFAASTLNLENRIEARVGDVNSLDPSERYDAIVFLGLLYHLPHPFLDLQRLAQLSDTMYLESTIDLGEEPYLFLKPPQEGVHHIPKWYPTKSCIMEMLKFCGFTNVKDLNDPTPRRASFHATR